MKTIIIAGGTGFLGKTLERYFTEKGYNKNFNKKPEGSQPHFLEW